jgi:hypothetical protein
MKKIFQNLLLSFISLILFILLAEGITRLLWNPVKNETDVRKGLILEGANRSVIYEGIEYKINSYGIRNRELSLEKDSNVTRIMALGDSFVWGDGLLNEDLVTVKLETTLKAKTGKDFEVFNTGIGGFNAQDEYEQLVRLYPIYKPDIVIQFFFTNDILATDGNNFITDWKVIYHMWLRKNSAFYSFLYYLIKSRINAEVSFPQLLLPQDYFNLNDKKPGWVNFKKYTGEIKKFCDSKEMRYYFILIPTLTNLDENYPYTEIKEKVTEFVNTLQVPFLSYFGLFSRYRPVDLWVSQSNTHWNGFATTLAAEELAEFLIKKENW